MTNKKPENNECEACPNVGPLAEINNLWLCVPCYAKEVTTNNSVQAKTKQIEVEPSTTPIDERLKKAFIDKTNSILLSGMTHEQVKYHIADLQDMVKVLNVQIQATMDIDDQWERAATNEEREKLREKDKAYRAKARPSMNADGTKKVKQPAAPKPVIVGDAGDKAFENLVEKLIRTGMDRPTAETMIRGMKGKK